MQIDDSHIRMQSCNSRAGNDNSEDDEEEED